MPRPTPYDDYSSVLADENVDIAYIGTPHAVHKQNCLAAIAAGKPVLCEKPLTINEKETQQVIDAARAKGVFLMEAVWTRFFPIMSALQTVLYTDKRIGEVQRVFCDFGIDMNLSKLPLDSRLRNVTLGAGALLDIGIYTLTFARLILGKGRLGNEHPTFQASATMVLQDGIDIADTIVLKYPDSNTVAVCTSTLAHKTGEDFCRIEGTQGSVMVFGIAPSVPSGLRIKSRVKTEEGDQVVKSEIQEEVLNFARTGGIGFFFEADAIAEDIAAGRTESSTMPLEETLAMMKLMDEMRRQGGVRYPQDE
jgi:predicted dehydrogenase